MNLSEIYKTKEKYLNAVIIVKDGNKVSLGGEDAQEYAAATGCSIGTIQRWYGDEKRPWVVQHDMESVTRFFTEKGRHIVIVDGMGHVITEKNKTTCSEERHIDNIDNKYDLNSLLASGRWHMKEPNGDLSIAIKCFIKALEMYPSANLAKYVIPRVTLCFLKQDDARNAKRYYLKTTKIYKPDYESVHNLIGIIRWLLNKDDLSNAIFFANKAKEICNNRINDELFKQLQIIRNKAQTHNEQVQSSKTKKADAKSNRKTNKKTNKVNRAGKQSSNQKHSYESYYKKANTVNTNISTKNLSQKIADIEEARKFVDTTLYPQGVRYGDAYRFRTKGKK